MPIQGYVDDCILVEINLKNCKKTATSLINLLKLWFLSQPFYISIHYNTRIRFLGFFIYSKINGIKSVPKKRGTINSLADKLLKAGSIILIILATLLGMQGTASLRLIQRVISRALELSKSVTILSSTQSYKVQGKTHLLG